MFIILYLAISLVMLYSEAVDCYRTKVKFNILEAFSSHFVGLFLFLGLFIVFGSLNRKIHNE